MNIETFRELMDIAIDGFAQESDKGKFFRRINISPVFKFGIPEKASQAESFDYSSGLQDGIFKLPFESFIILDTVPNITGGHMGWFIWRQEDNLLVIKITKQNALAFYEFARGEEKEWTASLGKNTKLVLQYYQGMLRPKLGTALPEHTEPEETCGNILESLSYFCDIVSSPGNFLVKVKPSKNACQGRSVQWVESKSHFVILGREHGKMLNNSKKFESNGAVTRAMHNRRAHKRLLQAERFKNKRGQSVWVKSSWVGPKEWQGTDKKIYKVVL
jgi:hypothetical protein